MNNNNAGIYTKGSLGVFKNVYIGDINHTNAEIQIGDKTQIYYEKYGNELGITTGNNLILNTTNNRSISYASTENLEYISFENHEINIGNNLIENINNSSFNDIKGPSIETYKSNLHTITTGDNKSTHHLPFYNNINSTSSTDVQVMSISIYINQVIYLLQIM